MECVRDIMVVVCFVITIIVIIIIVCGNGSCVRMTMGTVVDV